VAAPPFATIETRWFFDGDSGRHPVLRHWFESCAPFPRGGDVPAPRWTERAGGAPDVYLLMPGCRDMGIKWREGSLQIKGRVEDLGEQALGPRHQGRVQRWIKWTYERVPAAYRSLFATDAGHGLGTAAVSKTRALRLIGMDAEAPEEVAPGVVLHRGVGYEMTDLELDGKRYCSIAFEAFPDDAVTAAGFDTVVTGFLDELPVALDAGASMSYPDWLTT
jgi:hypothetical protein